MLCRNAQLRNAEPVCARASLTAASHRTCHHDNGPPGETAQPNGVDRESASSQDLRLFEGLLWLFLFTRRRRGRKTFFRLERRNEADCTHRRGYVGLCRQANTFTPFTRVEEEAIGLTAEGIHLTPSPRDSTLCMSRDNHRCGMYRWLAYLRYSKNVRCSVKYSTLLVDILCYGTTLLQHIKINHREPKEIQYLSVGVSIQLGERIVEDMCGSTCMVIGGSVDGWEPGWHGSPAGQVSAAAFHTTRRQACGRGRQFGRHRRASPYSPLR